MEIKKQTKLKLAIVEVMELLNDLYFSGKISIPGKTVAIPSNITFEIDLDTDKNGGELEFEFSWSKGKKKVFPIVLVLIHNRKEKSKLKSMESIFKRTGVSYKIRTLSSKISNRQLRSLLMQELNHGVELIMADEIISLKLTEKLREFITKPILTMSYKKQDSKNITTLAAYILGIKYPEIAQSYKIFCLTGSK